MGCFVFKERYRDAKRERERRESVYILLYKDRDLVRLERVI